MYSVKEQYYKFTDVIYIYSYTLNETYEFPAFITDFSETRNCSWNSQEIYGKMDPIYTYKNTTRKINIAFDVPCESVEQSKEFNAILRIHLKNSIYPIYKEKTDNPGSYALSSPPLHRIRYCNLIKSQRNYNQVGLSGLIQDGLLGWVEGYAFSPKLENGFFTESGVIFAKNHSVSLTLNVIHEHLLGTADVNEKLLPRGKFNTANIPQASDSNSSPNSPQQASMGLLTSEVV